MDDFIDMVQQPNVYHAQGTCREQRYRVLYQDLPESARLIHYEGRHEMNPKVMLQAISDFQARQ